MTRLTRALASLVVLAAVVATTAACVGRANGSATQTQKTTATSAMSSPSLSQSPTQMSEEDEDVENAEKAVVGFWRIFDRLGQDPQLPISEFLKVSRSKTYRTWSSQLQVQRGKRHRQVGDTTLISVKGNHGKPVEGRPTVKVQVCYDVSGVNLVDEDGKSLVSPDRVPRARAAYVVAKYNDGWFVVDDSAKGASC